LYLVNNIFSQRSWAEEQDLNYSLIRKQTMPPLRNHVVCSTSLNI